ncbi:MAG: branched-chain amino acid transport system permease protein [Betaproteobacteria bacterium]|jgi:branched-chain amino acid transport system permease protein|nr:branched-chain amino acid transport system permease protein [Betaproteobacteria bacterium]
MSRILSGDLPRSRVLATVLVLIVLGLLAAPFLFPGARSLNVAAKVAVFVLLVASYDLLLGYTGIVSFAHTMFFGIGGYGIGIAAARLGPTWGNLALGFLASLALTAVVALVIGLLSLRVRAVFFAMITLAVASFFQILASQLSDFTGGEDGLNFKLPELLQSRLASYYLVLAAAAALFLVLLRIVNSPFGRVLQSLRENEFRCEALGYRTVFYRTAANCLGALFATVAGALYAIWLRYTGPEATLSFAIMIDVLLMVVIGGMGTLYGAVIGATLFVVAQNYLQDLMKLASGATAGIPLLPNLLHPDRWLLWLGVLFIVCVYYFPTGIVGRLRR